MEKVVSIDEVAEHMINVGEQLIPYNFPQADPHLENELFVLKTREVFVDGYAVILHYNKSDYKNYFIETLQIFGKTAPFLPFNLIIKLAQKFLGGHNLSLSEMFKDNRKIYCWTIVTDPSGKPISPPQKDFQVCSFEGFKYAYIDAKNINLY